MTLTNEIISLTHFVLSGFAQLPSSCRPSWNWYTEWTRKTSSITSQIYLLFTLLVPHTGLLHFKPSCSMANHIVFRDHILTRARKEPNDIEHYQVKGTLHRSYYCQQVPNFSPFHSKERHFHVTDHCETIRKHGPENYMVKDKFTNTIPKFQFILLYVLT